MINELIIFSMRIKSYLFRHLNKLKFILLGVKLGKKPLIYNKVYLKVGRNSSIIIGDNFVFTSGNAVNPLCRNLYGCIATMPNARIQIGNNVGLSSTCIWAYKSIIIGNHVLIGGDVMLIDSDAHSLNSWDRRNSERDRKNRKSEGIVIGNDVLIGTKSIILKGVHIGDRVIVGAGSVVTQDIENDCIVAGNPAKVIRKI